MRFPWWQLDNHPEWVEQKREQTDRRAIRCMGIPRRLRLLYVPLLWTPPVLKDIEPDVKYRAYYFDPCTGARYDLGSVTADENGNWKPANPPPEAHDWIIVLEAKGT